MRSDLLQIYQQKLVSAEEAVQCVQDGDRVFIGTLTSIAYGLCEALDRRRPELKEVRITCSHVREPQAIFDGGSGFTMSTYFMGPQERNAQKGGYVDYTSVNLSQIEPWFQYTEPVDVAFIEVSRPDENGYMSLGLCGVTCHELAVQSAKKVVFQVNGNVPYLYGEHNLVSAEDADYIVELDSVVSTIGDIPFSGTIKTISDYIVEQVPDGACIQLGLGDLASAVGEGLKTKNDLGIHSEMLSESMVELMKTGVVNNRRKTFLPGKSVCCFALGSKDMYEYLDCNPDVYFAPYTTVNNPINIAKNDNMISINTAMSIDLMGQVVADNLAGVQYSAVGGQLDFVRGAQMAPGGKSFIAVTSLVESKTKGRSSRIVSRLAPGAAVTTPRAEVEYVVTEFGCVNLKRLTMRDRVKAMISLAHPDYRDQLTEEAKQYGML